MIEKESLLGNQSETPPFQKLCRLFIFLIFSLFIFIGTIQFRHNIPKQEIAIGVGGKCKDITCPGLITFETCKRALTDPLSGKPLEPNEPCHIRCEKQLDYDSKTCIGPVCTFTECCMIEVVYAQQFSTSCGAACLTAAEIELGFHQGIYGLEPSSGFEVVKEREKGILEQTELEYHGNRQVILHEFVDVDVPTLLGDPTIIQKAKIWGAWPRTLAVQFQGGRTSLFMNAPSAITELLTSAFSSFGHNWITKAIDDVVHEMRDNERVLLLVRSRSERLELHWVMIRPYGTIMDPAVGGTIPNLFELRRRWIPVWDIAIKLTAPLPEGPPPIANMPGSISAGSGSSLRRSKASFDLSQISSSLDSISSNHESQGVQAIAAASAGTGLRRSRPSASQLAMSSPVGPTPQSGSFEDPFPGLPSAGSSNSLASIPEVARAFPPVTEGAGSSSAAAQPLPIPHPARKRHTSTSGTIFGGFDMSPPLRPSARQPNTSPVVSSPLNPHSASPRSAPSSFAFAPRPPHLSSSSESQSSTSSRGIVRQSPDLPEMEQQPAKLRKAQPREEGQDAEEAQMEGF